MLKRNVIKELSLLIEQQRWGVKEDIDEIIGISE